jgi:hypothetical protein
MCKFDACLDYSLRLSRVSSRIAGQTRLREGCWIVSVEVEVVMFGGKRATRRGWVRADSCCPTAPTQLAPQRSIITCASATVQPQSHFAAASRLGRSNAVSLNQDKVDVLLLHMHMFALGTQSGE